MKERPILFSAPMVRANLEGSKTQTRRVLKQAVGPSLSVGIENEPGVAELSSLHGAGRGYAVEETIKRVTCPYGQPGDRLWVKETFYAYGRWENRYSEEKKRDEWRFIDMTKECGHTYRYAADPVELPLLANGRGAAPGWWTRSSLFMPRHASRITLEVTGVRVERLNDCSEADAMAEGLIRSGDGWRGAQDLPWFASPVAAYRSLWESINGVGSWDANPRIWVVEFRRVRP